MANTLQGILNAARSGKLSPEDQAKLKMEISAGIYDQIAAKEGIIADLNRVKVSIKRLGKESKTEFTQPSVIGEVPEGATMEGGKLTVTSPEQVAQLPKDVQAGLKQEPSTFAGRIGGAVKDFASGFIEEEKQTIERIGETQEAFKRGDIGKTELNLENLGNAFNTLLGGIKGGIEKAVIEPVISGLGDVAGGVQKAGAAITGEEKFGQLKPEVKEFATGVASKLSEAYNNLDEDQKRQLGIAGDAVDNFLVLLGGAQASTLVPRKTAQELSEQAIRQLDEVIDSTIEKAVKPSIPSVKAAGSLEAYKAKARDVVASIVENKNALKLTDEFGDVVEGKLPTSIVEFSNAVRQTKQEIYKKYSSVSAAAGEAGAEISLVNTADELAKVAGDSVLRDLKPEVVDYISKRTATLTERGTYTPTQTEEALKILNESLNSYYRNPTPESYSKAAVDSMIANNLRQQMEAAINATTGAKYQILRDQYAALKAVEKDIAQRALVYARRNQIGLIDFSDIFSAGDVVAGILSAQPHLIAKGAAQNLLKTVFKKITDPDRAIEKMFKQADEVLNTGKAVAPTVFKEAATPQTKIAEFKSAGAAVPEELALIKEAKKYKSAEEFVKANFKANPQTTKGADFSSNISLDLNNPKIVLGNDVITKNNPIYESTKKAIADGEKMPPIRISIDNNGNIIVKDGNHRLLASRELGKTEIPAVFDRKTLENIYTDIQSVTKSQLTDIWNKATQTLE